MPPIVEVRNWVGMGYPYDTVENSARDCWNDQKEAVPFAQRFL